MSNTSGTFSIQPLVRKLSLLIVDDSDFIRQRLSELFEDTDFIGTVWEAKNSSEALELFSSYSPDIVVLDINIPGDNGIKILEKMKSLRKDVIVMMLTNYPYDQYRKRCLELGADFFFKKSGDMDLIVEACSNIVINKYS